MLFKKLQLASLFAFLVLPPLSNQGLAQSHARHCDVQEQALVAIAAQSKKEADLAKGTLNALKKLNEGLEGRDWTEGIPLSEQMSSDELVTASEERFRIQILMLSQLIESKRSRDLSVISHAARTADEMSRNDFIVPDDLESRDFFVVSLIFALREMLPEPDESQWSEESSDCDFETALFFAALDTAKSVENLRGLDHAVSQAETFAKKYGKPLSAESMTPSDRYSYEREVLPALRHAQAKIFLADDLLRLALLERASKTFHVARRLDQERSPGDASAIGETYREWWETGKISESEDLAARAIDMIDEKIPSEFLDNLSRLNSQP